MPLACGAVRIETGCSLAHASQGTAELVVEIESLHLSLLPSRMLVRVLRSVVVIPTRIVKRVWQDVAIRRLVTSQTVCRGAHRFDILAW